MTLKRTTTTLVAITTGIALLAGCSPTSGPQPTNSSTPTPTSTSAGPVDPPKSEDEAVKAAEKALTEWFVVRGEVNAAGGKDTDRLKALSTGKALSIVLADAGHIASGPILNTEGKNVEGPAKTQGAIRYEPVSSYGQTYKSIENGLVTVHACQDGSAYKIFASDGSAAMQPAEQRNLYDYQVVYDSSVKAWLVSDLTDLKQTC